MRKELLNVAWLNGAMPMGNGGASGGGGVTINNQDKTVDIADNGTTKVTADSGYTGLGKVTVNVAIPTEEKVVDITENGTMEFVPESRYFSKVTVNTNVKAGGGDTPSRPTYTGHADVEGLKAIGWTDEDIAYYQANGINWNEEDDQYHKVPEDNIALYGVLNASNISTYKDRIVYLPKIDTSGVTSMNSMFNDCYSLISIPILDTSNVIEMRNMFGKCYSLTSVPKLDTRGVTNMSVMFYQCYSLKTIPQFDTSNLTNMSNMFYNCYSLTTIPQLNTSNVSDMAGMFYLGYSLTTIPQLDASNLTNIGGMFYQCYSLKTIKLKGLGRALELSNTSLLTKDSLLYIINNENATSAITIKLSSYCYTKYSTDADVVAALSNHPNISLAQ